jgi:phosphatidylserine decarboxylase
MALAAEKTEPAASPRHWRECLPLARWAYPQLIRYGVPLAAATAALAMLPGGYGAMAAVPGTALLLLLHFFRDPPRRIPSDPGVLVSPADGTIVEMSELAHDEFVGGPSLRIGVFLSIFNVHVNRAPAQARVVELRYTPGRFLNALNPQSARLNESMWIGLEELETCRRLSVRQISGAIARRIVCELSPGQVVERGSRFGMIKLGSRTELVLPLADGLKIEVAPGQKVRAGSTIVARYPV